MGTTLRIDLASDDPQVDLVKAILFRSHIEATSTTVGAGKKESKRSLALDHGFRGNLRDTWTLSNRVSLRVMGRRNFNLGTAPPRTSTSDVVFEKPLNSSA